MTAPKNDILATVLSAKPKILVRYTYMYLRMIAIPRPQVVNCSVAIGVAPFAYLLSVILNELEEIHISQEYQSSCLNLFTTMLYQDLVAGIFPLIWGLPNCIQFEMLQDACSGVQCTHFLLSILSVALLTE